MSNALTDPKLRKQFLEWCGIGLTAPMVAGVVIGIRMLGWMQPFEWMAYDQFMRSRPAEEPESRIVIVRIDEADIRTIKRWPVDDQTLATLIRKIHQQSPVAIGLDLHRDVPIEPGYRNLLDVYKSVQNLIAIEKRGGKEDIPVAPPAPLKALNQVAANDIVIDQDGKIRRALLYWTDANGQNAQETFGFRLAMMYLESQKNIVPEPAAVNSNYVQLGKAVFPIFQSNDGSYVNADAGGYQIMLNYRSPARRFPSVSLTEVIQGKAPPGIFRDRIVLIGPTAYSVKDLFYTPFSGKSITTPELMPGVEIQANIASQVLSSAIEGRKDIKNWNEYQDILWILSWACVGAGLGWAARSPRVAISSISLAGAILIGSCFWAFLMGWWIPVVPTAVAFVASAGVLTSYIAYKEHAERQTIMQIFGRHVTPEIAETIWRDRDQLMQQGRLPGRKMTATVLFTDLQDFSTVSERTDPAVLMSWLNEYMEAMTQTVLDRGGIVDKFIGDSIMAVFGVPIPRNTQAEIIQDAHKAVSCAIKMATALEALNQKWQSQGRPTTQMRVGISTGPVVTGSLGGQQRLDYTTIGDSVNVASRLESFDKSMGAGLCRILISENTYELIGDRFPTKPLAEVQLKGRAQPTKIYQILLESLQNTSVTSRQTSPEEPK
jgi:adenylate cyclase